MTIKATIFRVTQPYSLLSMSKFSENVNQGVLSKECVCLSENCCLKQLHSPRPLLSSCRSTARPHLDLQQPPEREGFWVNTVMVESSPVPSDDTLREHPGNLLRFKESIKSDSYLKRLLKLYFQQCIHANLFNEVFLCIATEAKSSQQRMLKRQ